MGEQQVLGWLLGGGLSQGSVSGAGESLTPTPPEPGSTWPCQDLFGKDFDDSGPGEVLGCPGLMERCHRFQHRHEHPALAQQHPEGTPAFLGQINCGANELTKSIPHAATWTGQHHPARLDWISGKIPSPKGKDQTWHSCPECHHLCKCSKNPWVRHLGT